MSLPLSAYRRLPRRYPLSRGFKRYALYFDGADDYVEVPHSDVLSRGLGDELTLEALIYVPEFKSYHRTFLVKGRTLSATRANYCFRYYFDGTNVYLDFYYRNSADTAWHVWRSVANPISAGRWYHVAVTFRFGDGTSLRYYVDGSLISGSWIAGDGTEAPYVSTEPLWVGAIYSLAEPFNGYIALSRVYRRILSNREIRYNMLNYHSPVGDGLVLWLHDRITAGTWYDESGYGNDGTIHGAVRKNLAMWELRAEVGL